ncbi:nucleotidyl transferase AbiEii/AbiGii toxin family protein [Elusimicrobiota bacterium]
MLSLDSLVSHAKARGLPAGKLRGSVREYIQVLILKALYGLPQAKGLVFLGGTALRFAHNLPRFSEDLDFDCEAMSFKEWKTLLEETGHVVARHGVQVEVKADEKGSLLTGDLRCQGFLQSYGLAQGQGEKLKIKMEANRPDYPIGTEPCVISAYGEMAPVSLAAPSLIIAEKILALLNRELGRDVYDLFFLAGKRWKPDERVLTARGVKTDYAQAILKRINQWGPKRLANMARKLEPFLFEPEQVRLVEQAHILLPAALQYLDAP